MLRLKKLQASVLLILSLLRRSQVLAYEMTAPIYATNTCVKAYCGTPRLPDCGTSDLFSNNCSDHYGCAYVGHG